MLKGLLKFDLPAVEEKVLAFWKENAIFAKSLDQRKGKAPFVFYEGPPTANAKPGVHHVIGRVFKDIIPRFKAMQGYYVPRRAGWDTHGLPVEIEVEKELGVKSKSEIEAFGIAQFNARARASVWKYKEEWEMLTERIGFWLDLEHPYITYENAYIEKVWGLIKAIDARKLLYRGHKVVPWCTRCGTALSSHELAQGYKEVTDTSVYLKFKIKDSEFKNAYIVSWTTTPWTLPGNVALAINPRHTFVIVGDLIFEQSSAKRLGLDISGAREIPAKKLLGLEYEPLFRVHSLQSKKSYKIYPADFVTADEGTGVVHTAVMYGEDDYGLGVKVDLPQHHTVDERGRFTGDVPGLTGLYVKDKATEEKILEHLKLKKHIFKIEPHTHDYPFCWRCGTALLYYATDSWFIAMSKLRKQLVAANKKVRWYPSHIKEGRFGEWLREAKDWALSRARYWGTPLPIWECGECGHYAVVGSANEIKELGGAVPDDLHRPFIDLITLRCLKCKKGTMSRVKEVIDVWFDSGAMPFASGEYPERYPADYICEGIDQTRGWFYTLMSIGVCVKKGAPYKNVICYSHLLDRTAKKMSKSKGNAVDPWELINAHGIDALRWYFYTSSIIKEAICFDERDSIKKSRQFIALLYNSYVFLDTYGGELKTNSHQKIKQHILDRWIIARLNETIKKATDSLGVYDVGVAAGAIEQLIEDMSRWYIRRSRKRAEALPVLRHVLLEISKLIAPFMPFFAEALYQSLKAGNNALKISVHLEDWPKSDAKLINKKLLRNMAAVREIASAALAKRAHVGIRVRQPLAALVIPKSSFSLPKELREVLKDEVNVKKIIVDAKLKEISLDTHITAKLRKEGLWRELIRLVQGLRQEAGCMPGDLIEVFVEGDAEIQKMIEERTADFLREVSAHSVGFGKEDAPAASGVADFDGIRVRAGIKKIA